VREIDAARLDECRGQLGPRFVVGAAAPVLQRAG
jgi:hypothetical protein